MKSIMRVEELAMTVAGIFFLTHYSLGLSGWIWLLLFFSPDLSMLGYLINTRIGAVIYNIFHHKALAIALALAGYFFHYDLLTAIGLLLFSHASFDRIWGYGLKYPDSFQHTHLGRIGKDAR